MRILLVKTSSLGDVVHTFPALTDAQRALPGVTFDWVVEEAFADIVVQHPAVNRVIPCALRRWRKSLWRTWRSGEWKGFKATLQAQQYDLVLDAQGLAKSAFITRLGTGPKAGFDKQSAREPVSARVLDRPLAIARGQHAITRLRQLFATALGYGFEDSAPDYGIARNAASGSRRLIFFHGTTWPTKHWPEHYWGELARLATQDGYQVMLPWGNEAERQRADRIAAGNEKVSVLPAMRLGELFSLLREVQGFVAVDTGLAHLAAGAGVPGIALYGPTDPVLTGVLGRHARSLAADFPCAPCVQERCSYRGELGRGIEPPCFSTLPPARVWQALEQVCVS